MVGMTRTRKPNRSSAGAKSDVLEQTAKALDNPRARFAVQLDPSQKLTQARMYADGGRKVAIMAALGQRAYGVKFPKTAEDVFTSLEDMLVFCVEYQLSPTLGIFAIWNGVTMQRVNQIERENDDRGKAVSVCKETIRATIEQATIESEFNPMLYLHMMKSQYGLAEQTQVNVIHEDNTTEITDDEYNERVVQLTQDKDGVYRDTE